MFRRRTLALLVALSVLFMAAAASASDPLAESLFQEGLTLLREGAIDEACEKLATSMRREHKSGTLISLAYCHERQGRTATAWAEYKDAAALADAEGRTDYRDKATALAATIEPKLSKVRIVAPELHSGAQLEVRLDGTLVLAGTFGTAFAIDPGEHVIRASAKGYEDWSKTITVGEVADRQTVKVPILERSPDDVLPKPTPKPVSAPAPSHAELQVGPQDRDEGVSDVAISGYLVGALGLAATGIGLAFGAVVLSKKATVEDECNFVTQRCSREGLDAVDAADTFSTASTVLVIAGAAALAGGLTLVLIDSQAEQTARLAPTPGGFVLEGRF